MHEVRAFFDGQNIQFLEPLGERDPQNVVVHFSDDQNLKPAEADFSARFEALFQIWWSETAALGNLSQVFGHPAFQKIVEIGRPAVPLILKKMQTNPSLIFVALEKITGVQPCSEEMVGKMSLIKETWLEWGRKNGHI